MNRQEVEDALAASGGFRVSAVGNRKVEFVYFYGEGENAMLRVKSTRPATPQECALWDSLLAVMMGVSEEVEAAGGKGEGVKERLPGGGGVDANTVRDPLGNPRE